MRVEVVTVLTGQMITQDVFDRAIVAAVRAPSMYNTQPWRFRLGPDLIEVRVDDSRSLPIADPTGWAARIGSGAAMANIQLALAAEGFRSEVSVRPTYDPVLAVVKVVGSGPAAPADLRLHAAIAARSSNRLPFWDAEVPLESRARLVAAAQAAGGWLELTDDRVRVAEIVQILRDADDHVRRDAAYVKELHEWIKHGEADRVGIARAASGLAPEGQDLLPMRDYGGRHRAAGRDFENEPLLGVLATVGGAAYDDVIAGVVLQRVLLTATSEGLATSMFSQAIEVPAARSRLRDALEHYGVPQMVIRVGYGQQVDVSPRRPVASFIDE